MNGFECFQLYIALKNHFTKKTYNFHKYNGKSKVTVAQYQTRNDKYYFDKLAKHSDPKGLLIANLISNQQLWIGDLVNDDNADLIYRQWKTRIDSFSYNFKQELNCFGDITVEQICKVLPNNHPLAIQMYLRKQISLEALVVFVDCVGCYSYWNANLRNDIVWEHISKLIVKYKPFLDYDKSKFKEIIKQRLKIVDNQ